MSKPEEQPIVIADKPAKEYCIPLLSRAAQTDIIVIQFADNNAPTAEYLLRLMRKGCGWIEIGDREKVQATSNACVFKSPEGKCSCPAMEYRGQCSESVRQSCANYKKRMDRAVLVNQVIVEKIAQARGL